MPAPWCASELTGHRMLSVSRDALRPGDSVDPQWSRPRYANSGVQVCEAGSFLAALAVRGHEPEPAARTLARARHSVPASFLLEEPDGGFVEGPLHWDYDTTCHRLRIEALRTATGAPGTPPVATTTRTAAANSPGSSASSAIAALTVIDGTSANNNGPLPKLDAGVLTTCLHAGAPHGRSEVMWGDENQQRLLFVPGDVVTVEFEVMPQLCGPGGELPPDGSTWHVVYQLHGALTDNTWPGPPVALVWQRGRWFLRGGYAVKRTDGSMRSDLGSQAPATPEAACGIWHCWKIVQTLGGPGVGSVDAWLNGRQVVADWKPAAGTYYGGDGVMPHKALQLKNGIYAGGTTPWPRTVTLRNILVSRTNDAGTKTWAPTKPTLLESPPKPSPSPNPPTS